MCLSENKKKALTLHKQRVSLLKKKKIQQKYYKMFLFISKDIKKNI